MKTTCMLSLPFVFSAAVVAQADTSAVQIPNLTFAHRTNLIDTDQSQTLETLSMADEFTRLPVSSYQTAGVYFITNNKGQVFSKLGNGGSGGGTGGPEFEDPTIKQCIGDGYKYNASNCPSGLPADTCPHNTGYFKTCCDEVYNYTEENCSLLNKSSSCGNKYRCDCSEEKYPVTANSCTSPQIPTTESGSSCTVNGQIRYTKCVCPTGVSAPYGCEEYYGGACNTVCKKAKSDNCDNRTAEQTPYGCESYYADCSSKCEKAYKDNCRNRTAVSAPNGCEQYYADCSSKCEIAKTDNCANRTAVDTPYGCKSYYSDCSTKCQTAYTDNCRNRTAVYAPYGCYSYYDDCPTKCKDANLGILYGDGSVSGEYPLSGKTPIGIVFDKYDRLAISLTNVNTDENEGSEKLYWSGRYDNIPNLEDCEASTFFSCGVDGRANTDTILARGRIYYETPAATACNLYQPVGCMGDFCKQGKWFLPSMRNLIEISLQKKLINAALVSLGKSELKEIASYWSSTEASSPFAWGLDMHTGLSGKYSKTINNLYVVPVVKF